MQVGGSAPSRGPVARCPCPGGHLTFVPPLCFPPQTTSAAVARRPMSGLLVSVLRSRAAVLSGSRARHGQTLVVGGTQFLSGLVVAVTEGEAQAHMGSCCCPTPAPELCPHRCSLSPPGQTVLLVLTCERMLPAQGSPCSRPSGQSDGPSLGPLCLLKLPSRNRGEVFASLCLTTWKGWVLLPGVRRAT